MRVWIEIKLDDLLFSNEAVFHPLMRVWIEIADFLYTLKVGNGFTLL